MVNTRYIADLIEKGEIGQIKEAMEKSLSPGSQSFEMALLELVNAGLISQEEALANADSATNLQWLLNNGPNSQIAKKDEAPAAPPKPGDDAAASFTEFTLDT
jgi:twitching motility protein PilU